MADGTPASFVPDAPSVPASFVPDAAPAAQPAAPAQAAPATMAQVNQPPVTGFKATGKQMLEGGAHFIHDLIDSDLNPVNIIAQHANGISPRVTLDQLVNKYIKQPLMAEQQKGQQLSQIASQREKQGLPATAEKVSAYAHDFASYLPFIGPMAAQAGEQLGKGDVGGGLLTAGSALLQARTGGKGAVPESAAGVGDVFQRRAQVLESSNAMLNKVAADTVTTLGKHQALVGWKIGQYVQALQDGDLELSASSDSSLGSISVPKAYEELIKAQQKFDPAQSKMPGVDKIAQLMQNQFGGELHSASKLTFEQAKSLRTDIGYIAKNLKVPSEKAIADTAYGSLTDQMRARSVELDSNGYSGMADRFDAYNKLNSTLNDYIHGDGILGKLINAKNGLDFFKELNRPSNFPELTALNKDFGQFGMADNFFKDLAASHKATFRLAKSAEGMMQGIVGRTQAVMNHPLRAGAPAAAAYALTPGPARYVASIAAAIYSAMEADQIDAAVEMRKQGGPPTVTGNFGAAANVQ